jgi:hypothetical protein
VQPRDDVLDAQRIRIRVDEQVAQLVVLELPADRRKELRSRRIHSESGAPRKRKELRKVLPRVSGLHNVLAHRAADLAQPGKLRREEIGQKRIAAETLLPDDKLESVAELGLGEV